MASNYFGNIFKITTWGESHGKAIGVIIDGCPAGVSLTNEDLNSELALRSPGKNIYTSPRKERDLAEIYAGVFDGKTTGSPISIIIMNHDADSSKYEPIKNLLRPGHANYTYSKKYEIFDYRGGGRASARETACRVAAGAVAKKILNKFAIHIAAYLLSVGDIKANITNSEVTSLKKRTLESQIFCPDEIASLQIIDKIKNIIEIGDSLGGVVEFIAQGLPIGLGDPIYEKLEANLAKGMLSIPASKGFEIGEGFNTSQMLGSVNNDLFIKGSLNNIKTRTNHAGGTLGGISTGMPLCGRVAFKPTSSINLAQQTLNFAGEEETFALPAGSRHDPCVAIRAVPVVEAMLALVIVDAILMNRCAKL